MRIKVKLDPAFEEGDLDSTDFVDAPNLSEEAADQLDKFTTHVLNGDPLVGKNKPSWLDDNQNVLPNTASYKEGDYWHYHCGEYYEFQRVKNLTYDLGLNIEGLTSPSVVHYIKESLNSIVIVGYSPEHIPFPPSDHPRKANPLFVDIED